MFGGGDSGGMLGEGIGSSGGPPGAGSGGGDSGGVLGGIGMFALHCVPPKRRSVRQDASRRRRILVASPAGNTRVDYAGRKSLKHPHDQPSARPRIPVTAFNRASG